MPVFKMYHSYAGWADMAMSAGVMLVACACIAAGAPDVAPTVAAQMALEMLPRGPVPTHGACLDGSPYGFYRLLNATSPDWVLYFDGGGACESQAGCVKRARTGGRLGSSTNFSVTTPANGLQTKDCDVNPFCAWNMVRLPYCSGDIWGGTQSGPGGRGYVAAGHHNVATALAMLLAAHHLGDAARVVVSGGSAGGIGAFQHADYIRELPELAKADVRAVPFAGWFFPDVASFPAWRVNRTAGFNWTKTETSAFLWVDDNCTAFHYDSSCGWVDESCRLEHPDAPWRCGTLDVAYRHIRTPLFVAEEQFDWEQCFGELKVPQPNITHPNMTELAESVEYLKYFGERMRLSLAQVGAGDNNGLWCPACLDHGAGFGLNNSKLLIDGVSLRSAVLDWYSTNGTGGLARNVHMEQCAEYGLKTPCSRPPGGCPKLPLGLAALAHPPPAPTSSFAAAAVNV